LRERLPTGPRGREAFDLLERPQDRACQAPPYARPNHGERDLQASRSEASVL